MAEHSVFPELIQQNGHSPEPTPEATPEAVPEAAPEAEPKFHFDPVAKTFTTSNGNVIELTGNTISALMLERVVAEGKPRIPRVEVTLLGKHKEIQANPHDPGYLALLKEWEAEKQVATFRYVFGVGVKGKPPEDFIQEQREYFPNATQSEMKYLWVSSKLPDEDVEPLFGILIGRSIATEAGLQESAASFRSKNQRDTTD